MSKVLDRFAERLLKEPTGLGDEPTDSLSQALLNPKLQSLVRVLHENPLLVEPTVRFVHLKLSEIAMSTLKTLYTPPELEELKRKHGLA